VIRHAEKLIAGLGGVIIVAVIASQASAIWRLSRERAVAINEARRLASEIDGHDFPAPEQDEQQYAGRVFAAWEKVPPPKETLGRYDFYISPKRR